MPFSVMKSIEQPTVELTNRLSALVQLGRVMDQVGNAGPWPGHSCGLNETEYGELASKVRSAEIRNRWFTEENVRFAFRSWAMALQETGLTTWAEQYPELTKPRADQRTVGLVLAGNIPMVGLHDVLCVWLSGHKAKIKCSSQDAELIPALIGTLDRFLPGTVEQLVVTDGKLDNIEAVIATGSSNTSRYFEHYFKHIPRIVRKGRVSVAVLDGSETEEELAALGEDIFRFFGMGCRNVAKLYLPTDFDLDRLFQAIFPWKGVVEHNKYGNNYDYVRALWMLDREVFLENGFLLLKEDKALVCPMGSLFYQRYAAKGEVDEALGELEPELQCIIGHGHLPFGHGQCPEFGDYADGVDTMRFLLELP